MQCLESECMLHYLCQLSTQIFENRTMVIRQEEELRWKQLSIDFMSEESDNDADPLAVVVHQPRWRSKRKCPL